MTTTQMLADVTVSYAENIAAGTTITNLSDASGGDTDMAVFFEITWQRFRSFALDTATGVIIATGKASTRKPGLIHTLSHLSHYFPMAAPLIQPTSPSMSPTSMTTTQNNC